MKLTRRIAYDSVLTALALVIFIVELQIPIPIPIPGVKLGLSNIITLFAMFAMGPLDAFIILIARIGLGSLFAGSVMSLFYSLAGGLMCYLITILLYKILTKNQVWVAGVFGAIMHITAQICIAVLITQTVQVFTYLPVLIIASIVTGTFTGLIAQFVLNRTTKLFDKLKK